MILEICELIGSMVVILVGCELFANAVEHIGRKFSLSHATAGSLLAAIGTTMPETIVPILALIFGGEHGEAVGIGAILGAPFMLLTLTIFLIGSTVLIMKLKGKRKTTELNISAGAISFDLKFFIFSFIFVLIGSLLYNATDFKFINYFLAFVLVGLYVYYVKVTLNHKKEEGETYEEFFYLTKYFSLKPEMFNVYLQLFVGLVMIIFGAKFFVANLIFVGTEIGVSMLVLSLLIAPIATELPEKYNSVTWLLKKKDTLAMSNITGAVAFQSTMIVALGLLFTEWKLDSYTLLNIAIALTSGILIFSFLKIKKKINAEILLFGGLFYALYIILAL
ncbi:MAG: hypothetical protein COZ91_02840 [Candidatus Nealsonbacteria bacterium CG_4_8_14_3_um_filter_39_7]|uniref:Sodium/calcium exchanger membrane region domain-containing protein n=1 Tax=Candidatus Nealsonbacteria bacterium CG23_combo_of_CG06-09_8_20_14_all_39_17 TaxID=1974722 RepID=A0A2G9YVH6_9BACT|nr:MAG: hypothetical protein COX37_02435 [Candidatus Nealsonbacteria bacterium CG23_combo_of_CG06-09_8_20_14_all_39_17]PIU44065.1 MAG: hypothetical protein COS96_01040 [Candidatus Nealsonbacteria bacterium CG07_land_8_20_14_0_80_39_13]PIW90998.1 MAG: hypothetical protein COZ91_02840 [Candidatus Nealsonbacteria bacterium CG_4_8_14_3_um_filter_39_7]